MCPVRHALPGFPELPAGAGDAEPGRRFALRKTLALAPNFERIFSHGRQSRKYFRSSQQLVSICVDRPHDVA